MAITVRFISTLQPVEKGLLLLYTDNLMGLAPELRFSQFRLFGPEARITQQASTGLSTTTNSDGFVSFSNGNTNIGSLHLA